MSTPLVGIDAPRSVLAAVRAFFAAAVATGADVRPEPRVRPEYRDDGASVRDPDGNDVEPSAPKPEERFPPASS